MKVWLAEVYDYENSRTVGIYTTEEAALAAAKEDAGDSRYAGEPAVGEYELEGELQPLADLLVAERVLTLAGNSVLVLRLDREMRGAEIDYLVRMLRSIEAIGDARKIIIEMPGVELAVRPNQ